jgi:hypothetical protein
VDISRRRTLGVLGGSALPLRAELPDIRTVAADLATPPTTPGGPAPGRRTRHSLPPWTSTDVHHTLYLPTDWKRGGRYPVIVEYAGNGNYRNRYGDISNGSVEGSNLGYGISGGRRFLWLCVPYINAVEKRNQELWWGDVDATVAYCKAAVRDACTRYGGDPDAVILTGFSRGAIACNYLGLRDDEIAGLWAALIPYSHYDGVRENWPYKDADRASALRRLARLRDRPQFIIHEGSVEPTREYLAAARLPGRFTFRALDFRNHNDAWTLRDIPERRELRTWLDGVLTRPGTR